MLKKTRIRELEAALSKANCTISEQNMEVKELHHVIVQQDEQLGSYEAMLNDIAVTMRGYNDED